MAIGIVSDSDFEAELERLKVPSSNSKSGGDKAISSDTPIANPSLAEIIEPKDLGRNGTKEIPSSLRAIIAEEKINGTPSKELQKLFNVSSSSVSAYRNGNTSLNPETSTNGNGLDLHVKRVKANIQKKARQKLNLAIEKMTPEKFDEAPLPVLSRVASDMAGIIERMEPKSDSDKPAVQFMIYAPRMEREENYSVIDVDN